MATTWLLSCFREIRSPLSIYLLTLCPSPIYPLSRSGSDCQVGLIRGLNHNCGPCRRSGSDRQVGLILQISITNLAWEELARAWEELAGQLGRRWTRSSGGPVGTQRNSTAPQVRAPESIGFPKEKWTRSSGSPVGNQWNPSRTSSPAKGGNYRTSYP